MAGDFNAKAFGWGEGRPDSRGGRVLDMASRTGLVILITGFTSAIGRAGYRETLPDISLVNKVGKVGTSMTMRVIRQACVEAIPGCFTICNNWL